MFKYMSEYLKQKEWKYSSKQLRRLMKTKKHEGICDICHFPKTGERCICLDNADMRIQRLKFNKSWYNAVRKRSNLCKDIDLNTVKMKDLHGHFGTQLYKLSMVRGLISTVQIGNLRLRDIPFGVIYKTYTDMFVDKEWLMAENLGLSEELFERAKYIWSNYDNRGK